MLGRACHRQGHRRFRIGKGASAGSQFTSLAKVDMVKHREIVEAELQRTTFQSEGELSLDA